jgi:hypothetical protein
MLRIVVVFATLHLITTNLSSLGLDLTKLLEIENLHAWWSICYTPIQGLIEAYASYWIANCCPSSLSLFVYIHYLLFESLKLQILQNFAKKVIMLQELLAYQNLSLIYTVTYFFFCIIFYDWILIFKNLWTIWLYNQIEPFVYNKYVVLWRSDW